MLDTLLVCYNACVKVFKWSGDISQRSGSGQLSPSRHATVAARQATSEDFHQAIVKLFPRAAATILASSRHRAHTAAVSRTPGCGGQACCLMTRKTRTGVLLRVVSCLHYLSIMRHRTILCFCFSSTAQETVKKLRVQQLQMNIILHDPMMFPRYVST